MFLRLLIFSVAAVAAMGLLAPAAHGDPAQDQQYLDLVHSNGVGGSNELLIDHAHQCAPAPSIWEWWANLLSQIGWFNKSGIYVIQTAASRSIAPIRLFNRHHHLW